MFDHFKNYKIFKKVNGDYLLNLSYRLDFEIELQTFAYSVDLSDAGDAWIQPNVEIMVTLVGANLLTTKLSR